MTLTDLYEHDFAAWTRLAADGVRKGQLAAPDADLVAQELEDMGKRERRELESRCKILMTHLLKWSVQADRRSRSWRATINVQRMEIARLLRQMPSLRAALAEDWQENYAIAVQMAEAETGLGSERFPNACPWSVQELVEGELVG